MIGRIKVKNIESKLNTVEKKINKRHPDTVWLFPAWACPDICLKDHKVNADGNIEITL
jgi:hypothetical protein